MHAFNSKTLVCTMVNTLNIKTTWILLTLKGSKVNGLFHQSTLPSLYVLKPIWQNCFHRLCIILRHTFWVLKGQTTSSFPFVSFKNSETNVFFAFTSHWMPNSMHVVILSKATPACPCALANGTLMWPSHIRIPNESNGFPKLECLEEECGCGTSKLDDKLILITRLCTEVTKSLIWGSAFKIDS